MFSPCGPTATPASTIPTMCGMRSLPIIIGAKRMMHSTTKNIIVGDVMGKYCDKSGMKCYLSCDFMCKIAKKIIILQPLA